MERFDIDKYLGRWYQISSIPMTFSNDCTRSIAHYSKRGTQYFVTNTCLDELLNVKRSIDGTISIPNPETPAYLNVKFSWFQSNSPNYIVLKTDYVDYSLVGSPDKSGLYILSRTPEMDVRQYKYLLDYAKNSGYNISKIKIDTNALLF